MGILKQQLGLYLVLVCISLRTGVFEHFFIVCDVILFRIKERDVAPW